MNKKIKIYKCDVCGKEEIKHKIKRFSRKKLRCKREILKGKFKEDWIHPSLEILNNFEWKRKARLCNSCREKP